MARATLGTPVAAPELPGTLSSFVGQTVVAAAADLSATSDLSGFGGIITGPRPGIDLSASTAMEGAGALVLGPGLHVLDAASDFAGNGRKVIALCFPLGLDVEGNEAGLDVDEGAAVLDVEGNEARMEVC